MEPSFRRLRRDARARNLAAFLGDRCCLARARALTYRVHGLDDVVVAEPARIGAIADGRNGSDRDQEHLGATALGRAEELLTGLARMEISARLVTDRLSRSSERFVVPDLGGADWMPLVSCLPLQVLTYLPVQRRGIDVSLEMGGVPYGTLYGDMHVDWTKHSAIDARP